ncbi:DUF4194 domain-containing protein [Gordonia polyisoprenivorans]|uniref:DUF4194 domain-containing protein n=1 Tax=Gordonia polyisoprenivorans TaxID=84595 RepID=UPI000B99DB80|nr:DUF4194 domain-containing protein [Gordonia polyisoprenivorans]OZC29678.1 hypothetical protein CJJ17_23625 [Gordonia polyisoprenivorans]QUD81369.1 DUF4194 domain-containing protein [Gordonia polyisoprenivorans]
MTRSLPRDELSLPLAVTALMKGVVYRDTNETSWAHIQGLATQISDYVATLGLTVLIDDAEGYAFLRSKSDDELTELGIPRLVPRHQLPLHTSLLLALLRKRLAEFDSDDAGARLVLSGEQITEMMLPFLPQTTNEARAADQIETAVRRVSGLGFLRRLPKQENQFEVRRVIKAFVDAQWLADLDTHLSEYAENLAEGR